MSKFHPTGKAFSENLLWMLPNHTYRVTKTTIRVQCVYMKKKERKKEEGFKIALFIRVNSKWIPKRNAEWKFWSTWTGTNETVRSVDSRPKLLYFPSAIHSSAPSLPPLSLSSAWFEWLANEEDNENREKMIPRNHCARTFQRLSPNVSHCAKSSNPRLAPFDEKSASHATDLNYDCHTSCVSFREMMKGRINSIRCVFRVTNRSRIRSFASFIGENVRIRVKLCGMLSREFIEVFIFDEDSMIECCSSCFKFIVNSAMKK